MDPPPDAARQRFRDFDTTHDDASDFFGGAFGGFEGMEDFDSVIFGQSDTTGSVTQSELNAPHAAFGGADDVDDPDMLPDLAYVPDPVKRQVAAVDVGDEKSSLQTARLVSNTSSSASGTHSLSHANPLPFAGGGRLLARSHEQSRVGDVEDDLDDVAGAIANIGFDELELPEVDYDGRRAFHADTHLDSHGVGEEDGDGKGHAAVTQTFMSSSTTTEATAPASPHQTSIGSQNSHVNSPVMGSYTQKRSASLPGQQFIPTTHRPSHATSTTTSTTTTTRGHGDPRSSVFSAHELSSSAALSTGSFEGGGDVDWDAARSALVFNVSGDRVSFDKMWAGLARNTVLVFVNQKNIEVIALIYGRVAHLLQQVGSRVVFISPWTPKQGSIFLDRYERINPFPGTLLCDPNASLFFAFGLRRSALSAMLPHKSLARQFARSARAHRDLASASSNASRIKCGAVVIENTKHPADVPALLLREDEASGTGPGCYLDVLQACGVNGAFIPELDVAHVVSRFHSMKANADKTRAEAEKEEASTAHPSTSGGRSRRLVE